MGCHKFYIIYKGYSFYKILNYLRNTKSSRKTFLRFIAAIRSHFVCIVISNSVQDSMRYEHVLHELLPFLVGNKQASKQTNFSFPFLPHCYGGIADISMKSLQLFNRNPLCLTVLKNCCASSQETLCFIKLK